MAKYRFWIKSNRGTNNEAIVDLAVPEHHEPTVRAELETWCSQFGAWHHGDNVVNYGFERLNENDS